MSTRSTIRISSPRKDSTHIYRHMDGYPAIGGFDLANTIAKHPKVLYRDRMLAVTETLLRMSYSEDNYIYELTELCEDHSDREWHYEVALKGNDTKITVYSCQYASPQDSRKTEDVTFTGTIESFLKYTEKERNTMVERAKALA